jgi:hypothetical protein
MRQIFENTVLFGSFFRQLLLFLGSTGARALRALHPTPEPFVVYGAIAADRYPTPFHHPFHMSPVPHVLWLANEARVLAISDRSDTQEQPRKAKRFVAVEQPCLQELLLLGDPGLHAWLRLDCFV